MALGMMSDMRTAKRAEPPNGGRRECVMRTACLRHDEPSCRRQRRRLRATTRERRRIDL
jgi:hypothetical protein